MTAIFEYLHWKFFDEKIDENLVYCFYKNHRKVVKNKITGEANSLYVGIECNYMYLMS